ERSRIVAVVPDAGPRIVMDEVIPDRHIGGFTHLLLRAVIGDLITLDRRAVSVLPVVTTIAVVVDVIVPDRGVAGKHDTDVAAGGNLVVFDGPVIGQVGVRMDAALRHVADDEIPD